MNENKGYFLSGGVLFFMLTQATLPNGSPRDHRDGVKDDHSEPILMTDFIYTFTGSRNYGTAKDTSKYKDCDSEGSINTPFNDASAISTYDDTVRNRYDEALSRMDEFVTWHLNPEKRFWLVKALIEILENDTAVTRDDLFFTNLSGIGYTIEAIKKETGFCMPALLVGLLHYVLTKRCGRNADGAMTLNSISEKKPRKPRKYIGRLGEGITRHIDVTFSAPQRKEAPSESADAHEEATDPEVVIADGNTEEANPKTESVNPQMTIIQQQINVIQSGEQNVNLTNNGTMTINL